MKDNSLVILLRSKKTIFSVKDLALIWGITDDDYLKTKIYRLVKNGNLLRIKKGIYVLDKNYNIKELAVSIYTPSYISFETVLREAGIIFQHYETFFVAGSWSKTIKIDKKNFCFRKIKKEILFNSLGVINKDNYSIANSERAFLDMIYLFPDYYFDNLSVLDWDKCFELVKIYNNKELIKRLNKYHKDYVLQEK